ncbi:hypothetical protein ACFL6I_26875 [candidate division KSB1 bacterium]
MLTKRFPIRLTYEDMIDVTLAFRDNTVKGFVLNYRAKIGDKWHDIYRVDTCHGYLHEQRFWRSPRPIKLPQTSTLKLMFDFFLEEIRNNHEKYKRYYKNALQDGR